MQKLQALAFFIICTSAFASTDSELLLDKAKRTSLLGPVVEKTDDVLVARGYRRDDDVLTQWSGTPTLAGRRSFTKTITYRSPQGEWEVPQTDGSKRMEKYSAVEEVILSGKANPARPNDLTVFQRLEIKDVGYRKD